LILAGPILRRVEPALVSVWLALREPASVTLTLWEGRATPDKPSFNSSPAAPTLRIGDQLHIVVVTLKIPAASGKTLLPNRIYSYDLTIKTASGETKNLKTSDLLKDGSIKGRAHLALGYETDVLPSFSLPPAALEDLRLVHGSCRRPNNPVPDGLVWLDDLINEARLDQSSYALKRPHQLLMTGDQIYADDVARLHLYMLNELSKTIIGSTGFIPVERLTVEHLTQGVDEEEDAGDAGEPGQERNSLPADRQRFPPGLRTGLILDECRMTSTGAHSHLLSFGEFCAMYLSVWSNSCWPVVAEFPPEEQFVPPLQTFTPRPAHLSDPFKDDDGRELSDEKKEEVKKGARKAYVDEKKIMVEFLEGLPKVRRALANVPTYMMFDDHEVTDDWYLNPIWRDRVLTNPLGKTVIRNGMLSYALFQDWGNDPVRFESGDYKELLKRATELFPAGAETGPNKIAGDEIDRLLGFNQPSGLEAGDPPIKWHYSVPGQKHLLVALDNRTRRSYVSRVGPPGNVSIDAQQDQLPAGPLAAGIEVLVLMAPLPVIGPPVFDELFAPLAYRAFDLISHKELEKHSGSKGMTGTNPDAIEAWAFDAVTFEALLKRLEACRRPVFILSGDVHFGTSNVMSYWKKGDAEPSRFAQFTSSGMKNVMPWYVRFIDRSLAFGQRMLRSKIGAERLGWDREAPAPLQLPAGAALVPALAEKLKRAPVMLPAASLPAGTRLNPAHPPDWSWRVEVGRDVRPDGARPAPARPESLGVPDAARNFEGYRRLAKRHAGQLENLNNSRQILFFNNLGLVTFKKRVETINSKSEEITDVTHALYTSHPNAANPAKGEAYTVHVVPLRAPAESRPEERLKPAV
jgi:hypothetical protein